MEQQPEKKQTAIEFVKAKLALNPEASFAEIKAQAKVEGIPVFPVVYGRAKALLGLVPTAPYGSKSKLRAQQPPADVDVPHAQIMEPAARPAPVHGNGAAGSRTMRAREAQARAAERVSDLEVTITLLENAVRERDRYRGLLQRIADLIRSELPGT